MTLKEFKASDKELIIKILLENQWTFHGKTNMSRAECELLFEKGYFSKNDVKTFIIQTENKAIGFVRIFDLDEDRNSDDIPLFDIRINQKQRNKGAGKYAVRAIVSYIFKNYPNKNRIEATTRIDNTAMRKVLLHCGFVKEAHYRASWKSDSGALFDTIGYGILRKDWETGKVSPLNWDD